jgi:hypothetical protein
MTIQNTLVLQHLLRSLAGAKLLLPGEAESGSAGVQPDKEYPGRRCADGASRPPNGYGRVGAYLFPTIGHRSDAWKTHQHAAARRHVAAATGSVAAGTPFAVV